MVEGFDEITKVLDGNRITIPQQFREGTDIGPGDHVAISFEETEGKMTITAIGGVVSTMQQADEESWE